MWIVPDKSECGSSQCQPVASETLSKRVQCGDSGPLLQPSVCRYVRFVHWACTVHLGGRPRSRRHHCCLCCVHFRSLRVECVLLLARLPPVTLVQ